MAALSAAARELYASARLELPIQVARSALVVRVWYRLRQLSKCSPNLWQFGSHHVWFAAVATGSDSSPVSETSHVEQAKRLQNLPIDVLYGSGVVVPVLP